MAAGHRTANRAKAKAQRAKDRRRANRNHPHVSAWLGAGALTIGVGAAMASGAAVASAAPQHAGDSGSSASSSGATSTGASPGTKKPSAAAGPTRPSRPSGAKKNINGDAKPSSDISSATITLADPEAARADNKASATAKSVASSGNTVSSAANIATSSPAATTRAVAHEATVPSGATRTGGASAAESFVAPVVPQIAPRFAQGTFLPRLLNLVESLLGVTPGVTPDPRDTIKVFLYGFFTRLQEHIDPAPTAGAPIVGTADPNTGKVIGAAGFTTTPGDDVTYTAPTTSTGGGAISVVTSTGAFTYTPSAAQRLTAVIGTTDTFVITAHDDLLTSTVTVTVPVDGGTPVARIPTVGTPQAGTGVVVGNAVFTDPAGRTLTYSAGTTSSGGGAVTIDTATGAFTFTPTPTQRFGGTFNTDIFTVTASNGVHTTAEIITVPINNFSNSNEDTHGFTVYNLSSQTLQYQGVLFNQDGNSLQDQPVVGSIIKPGQSQTFSLVLYFLASSKVGVNYLTPEGDAVGQAIFEIDGVGDDTATCQGNCSISGNTVYFQDPPGTVITVPVSDPTGQAEVLQSLCGQSTASCTFKATSEDNQALGPSHPVGSEVRNASNTTVSTSIGITDAVSQTDSIGIGTRASGSILGIVTAEISATYGHTWTTTQTFTQTVNVTVEPHSVARVVAEQPIYRVTGDFTIVFGNTTYLVKGVVFESPRTGQGVYTVTDEPITAARQESAL